MPSSCFTKHINARYFLLKDKQDCREIKIKYDPTDVKWSDVLTKAKQGQSYHAMHTELMNFPVDYDDDVERRKTQPCLLPNVEIDAQTRMTENLIIQFIR